ncbi:MAG: glycosyltransferase, partial [bacterium]|nr:glycosyltransferase [bacterium]
RNLAIKHSKGPWLAFLDADDVWLPNTLAVFAEHFNDSDFMFGEYSYLGGPNNGKTVTDFSDLPNNKDELLKRLIQGNFIGIGGVCVKTDLVTQYFDESLNFAEDYKLWLTLLMKDIKVKKINKVVYKYRIHPESALHKNSKQNLLLAKLLLSFSEQNKYAKIRASRYYSYYVNTAISESLKNKYYRPDFSDYKKFDLNHKTKLKIYLYMKHFKLLTKVSEIISKRKSKYRMIVV